MTKYKPIDRNVINTTSVMSVLEIQFALLEDWIPELDRVNTCFDVDELMGILIHLKTRIREQYK